MRKGAYQRVAAPRDAIALGYSLVDPSPTSTFDVINVVGHRVCRWEQPSDGQPVRRARGQFELARVGAPGEGGCKVSTASLSLDDSSVGFLPFVLPLPALLHTRRLASRAGGLPFPRAGRHFAGVCDRLQKPRDRLLSSFLAASLVLARHVQAHNVARKEVPDISRMDAIKKAQQTAFVSHRSRCSYFYKP